MAQQDKQERLKQIKENENKIKRIALSILEQCKGENLTISETDNVIDMFKHLVRRNTYL